MYIKHKEVYRWAVACHLEFLLKFGMALGNVFFLTQLRERKNLALYV